MQTNIHCEISILRFKCATPISLNVVRKCSSIILIQIGKMAQTRRRSSADQAQTNRNTWCNVYQNKRATLPDNV